MKYSKNQDVIVKAIQIVYFGLNDKELGSIFIDRNIHSILIDIL